MTFYFHFLKYIFYCFNAELSQYAQTIISVHELFNTCHLINKVTAASVLKQFMCTSSTNAVFDSHVTKDTQFVSMIITENYLKLIDNMYLMPNGLITNYTLTSNTGEDN